MLLRRRRGVLGALILVLGCDADEGLRHAHRAAATAMDTRHVADAGALDSDASAARIEPPNNRSFETALEVEPGADALLQPVRSETQADYFQFMAEAGVFYALTTVRGNVHPDTILRLFDGDHTPLAENDDGGRWPGDRVDSRLVVRLQHAGVYFVEVSDPTATPDAFEPGASPLIYYLLRIEALREQDDGVTAMQSDAPAIVRFARDANTGYAYSTVIGAFEAANQNERFELAGAVDQILVGHVLPSGAQGNGSSATFARLSFSTRDHHTLARIDRDKHQTQFHPPIADASYELSLSTDRQPGSNGFYAIDLVLLPDNPQERSDRANDQLAGAELIALQGGFTRRGLLLTRLPPEDVDYYSFEAQADQLLYVGCEGESGGSGVHGLRTELRDADDRVLASVLETADANSTLENLVIPATGSYFLRLTSDTPRLDSEDQPEPWARCVVLLRG